MQVRLKDTLTNKELQLLPTGFQQIGDKAILTLKPELLKHKAVISQEILDAFKIVKGVYLKIGGVVGEYRTPQIEFIRGEDTPEVIHKEHGISYKFDITKIMFSKGNINERKRISDLVQPDEVIFDLFAGIGYFSLVIGLSRKPLKIYAFELNPVAYHYLVENIKLNKINEAREIIVPILGDSKAEALKIAEKANRVIMGILPASRDHIETVFKIIDDRAIIHYEGLIKEKEDPEDLLIDFEKKNKHHNRKIKLINTTYVKSYGPKTYHITLDILIS